MICSMATSIVLSSMGRKRGNPNWGRPIVFIPAAATEFENSCEGWDSPGKRAEVPLIYESGASGTETGATSRNGCLTLGILKWIHCLGLSAAEKCNRPAAIRPRVSLFPTISYQRPRQPHDLAVARNKRKRRPGTTLVW